MYTDTDILYSDADRLLQAKDLISDWEYIRAKNLIEEVLDDEPANAYAHFLLAHIFDNHYTEYGTALKHYEIAIRIDKHFSEAISVLMPLYNKCGLTHKAIQLGEKAIKQVSPYKEMIHFEYALALEVNGEFEKSRLLFEELRLKSTCNDRIEDINSAINRIENKLDWKKQETKTTYTSWEVLVINST